MLPHACVYTQQIVNNRILMHGGLHAGGIEPVRREHHERTHCGRPAVPAPGRWAGALVVHLALPLVAAGQHCCLAPGAREALLRPEALYAWGMCGLHLPIS